MQRSTALGHCSLPIIEASRYTTLGRTPLDELWFVQNLEIHTHSCLKEIKEILPLLYQDTVSVINLLQITNKNLKHIQLLRAHSVW
jgi:hypothetical protein